LKQQVRVSEGGEDEADLGLIEIELLFEYIGSSTDIHPVDVGQKIHQTDQKKDDIAGREQGRPAWKGGCNSHKFGGLFLA
jgi:hypothetical protein